MSSPGGRTFYKIIYVIQLTSVVFFTIKIETRDSINLNFLFFYHRNVSPDASDFFRKTIQVCLGVKIN